MKYVFTCTVLLWLMFGGYLLGVFLDRNLQETRELNALRLREVTALEQISLHLANIRSDMTVSMSRDNIRKYQVGNSTYYMEE